MTCETCKEELPEGWAFTDCNECLKLRHLRPLSFEKGKS